MPRVARAGTRRADAVVFPHSPEGPAHDGQKLAELDRWAGARSIGVGLALSPRPGSPGGRGRETARGPRSSRSFLDLGTAGSREVTGSHRSSSRARGATGLALDTGLGRD